MSLTCGYSIFTEEGEVEIECGIKNLYEKGIQQVKRCPCQTYGEEVSVTGASTGGGKGKASLSPYLIERLKINVILGSFFNLEIGN